MIKINKTDLDGFLVIEPQCFHDSRGFFLETYQREIYFLAGIKDTFVLFALYILHSKYNQNDDNSSGL